MCSTEESQTPPRLRWIFARTQGPSGAGFAPSRDLVKARVEALSSYRWSSYQVYVGKARNPGWLTTESIYRFFGDHTLHSLRGAYRQQLEEIAALGQWETDWRDFNKATIVLGLFKVIQKMLSVLKS